MSVRGLTILLAGDDPARFRSALELAATQAALGGRSRLFLQTVAVPLIAAAETDAERLAAAGLPTRADLIETALALGSEIILCQSGLALAGLSLKELDPRLGAGGIAGLLATLEQDRLLVV